MMCACVSEEDGNGDGVDFQELSGLSDTDLCGCVMCDVRRVVCGV